MGNVASVTSNSSSGPNGAHRFVVIVFSAHIVVDATRINGHIKSNNLCFFLDLTMQTHIMLLIVVCFVAGSGAP